MLSLGRTKAGARQGAAESVTLHEDSILPALYGWKQSVRPAEFLTPKPHQWRSLFASALEALQSPAWRGYFSGSTITVHLTACWSKAVGLPQKWLGFV